MKYAILISVDTETDEGFVSSFAAAMIDKVAPEGSAQHPMRPKLEQVKKVELGTWPIIEFK